MKIVKILQILLLTAVLSAFISLEKGYAQEICEWWNYKNITVGGKAVKVKDMANASHDELRATAANDAQPQLIERLIGIRITAGNIVNKEQATAVAALGKTIEEKFDAKGNIKIEFGVPVYGEDSLAKIVFKKESIRPLIKPSKEQKKVEGDYTSLVIDCAKWEDSNKKYLNPVMIPELKDDAGKVVYGYGHIDYDTAVNNGYAQYAMDLTHQDIGNKPLIIQAVGIADELGNPIISAKDTDRILSENLVAHFLENASVIIISRSVKSNINTRGTKTWGNRDSSGYSGGAKITGAKG